MTPQEAAALVAADKQARSQAFAEYIEVGRKQFNCDFVGVPEYAPSDDGAFVTTVKLVLMAR
jgi:hypothetical protein